MSESTRVTVAQAEPGMEFVDVTIDGITTSTDVVGGKTITTAVLRLIQLDGSVVALTIGKNIDITVRYGEFMKIAKRVRISRKSASKVFNDGNGNLVAKTELYLETASNGLTDGMQPGEVRSAAMKV